MAAQEWSIAEQDRFIAEAIEQDASRLRSFISKRVFDMGDAEDVMQDVFYELIQTYRLMKPVEQVTAWLYRVARNRITDLFRKPRLASLDEPAYSADTDGATVLDLLPSDDDGPDALYARELLLASLDEALEELPEEQREVFLAHEIEGRSFKQMSDETGTSINTLLSRKRYAVLHLRRRLEEINRNFSNE